jgi:hypothetical protein
LIAPLGLSAGWFSRTSNAQYSVSALAALIVY